MDCEHMNITRVADVIDGGYPEPPQDGVFTYYCKDCHLTLYVKFTDAPPIIVEHGRP